MVNAYVTGLGGTKRIVLWDTILAIWSRTRSSSSPAHEWAPSSSGTPDLYLRRGYADQRYRSTFVHRVAGS